MCLAIAAVGALLFHLGAWKLHASLRAGVLSTPISDSECFLLEASRVADWGRAQHTCFHHRRRELGSCPRCSTSGRSCAPCSG